MAWLQEKDVIKYEGKRYKFTYNLTTRETNGDYPPSSKKCVEKLIVDYFLDNPNTDGYAETLIKIMYGSPKFYQGTETIFANVYRLLENITIKKLQKYLNRYIMTQKGEIGTFFLHDLIFFIESDGKGTKEEYDCMNYFKLFTQHYNYAHKYVGQFLKYQKYLKRVDLGSRLELLEKQNVKIETPSSLLDFIFKVDTTYQIEKSKFDKKCFEDVTKINSKINGETENFIISIPTSIEDIVNEGEKQNNCLATYVEKYLKQRSILFWVHKKDNPEQSYIDCEIHNRELEQCLLSHNCLASKEERKEIVDYLLNLGLIEKK